MNASICPSQKRVHGLHVLLFKSETGDFTREFGVVLFTKETGTYWGFSLEWHEAALLEFLFFPHHILEIGLFVKGYM